MYSIDTNRLRQHMNTLEQAGNALGAIKSYLFQISVSQFVGGNNARIIQRSIDSLGSTIKVEQQQAVALSQVLAQIATQYERSEQTVTRLSVSNTTNNASQLSGSNNLAENSALFDDKGSYGGDQGDMAHNQSGVKFSLPLSFLPFSPLSPFFPFSPFSLQFRLFENEELFDTVRTYEGYENYSDDQIANLFNKLNSEGCGYVAIVNSVFMQYESDPAAFEKAFGFPMYDDKGEFNFNRLTVDFYINTDDQFYLDENQGTNALVADVLNSYKDHPQDFVDKYGIEPFRDEDHYNVDAMQKVADDYQSQSTATFTNDEGTTVCSLENRMSHYFKQKGISASCETYQNMSAADVKTKLEGGKCVNIRTTDFNLYNDNGEAVQKDVGGHWMTVTEVTNEGNYVVSSWGEKYYIHPSELKRYDMLIMDI